MEVKLETRMEGAASRQETNGGSAREDAESFRGGHSELYRLLVESLPDLVYYFRLSPPHFEYIGPGSIKLLGYTPDELYADPQLVVELVHPDDRQVLEAMVERPEMFENPPPIRWIRKDGRMIWTEQHNTLIRDEEGRVVAVHGSARDITARKLDEERLAVANDQLEKEIAERKQVEQALRENAEQLQANQQLLNDIIDSMPALVFARDLQGKLVLLNDSLAHLFNRPKEQALGTTDYDIFPQDMADVFSAMNQKVIAAGLPRKNEEVIVQDGVPHTFLSYKFPIRDARGHIYGLGGVNTDITERKQLEEQLRQRAEEVEKVMDLAPIAIWVGHDPQCHDITGNRTANQFYEAEAGENVSANNTPVRRFFQNGRELAPEELPMQYAAANNVEVHGAEFEVLLPSGTRRSLWGYAVPLHHADGRVRGSIGAFVDVTALKRADLEREELLEREQAARAQAEEAIRLRDQFISVASHELRTPLTPALGYAQLLEQRADKSRWTEQERRMIHTVKQQTLRLNKMISALLDASRFEKGQLNIERAPLDLANLLRTIVEETRPTLRRHTLELEGLESGLIIEGDELRLEQVFQNLLQNAIKYSPQGGPVSIKVWQDGRTVFVAVADRGIGIPSDAVPQLFTRFFRASNAEAAHITGLGVGLYVVREVVRLHGGDIQVESEKGRGSTFIVQLLLANREGA